MHACSILLLLTLFFNKGNACSKLFSYVSHKQTCTLDDFFVRTSLSSRLSMQDVEVQLRNNPNCTSRAVNDYTHHGVDPLEFSCLYPNTTITSELPTCANKDNRGKITFFVQCKVNTSTTNACVVSGSWWWNWKDGVRCSQVAFLVQIWGILQPSFHVPDEGNNPWNGWPLGYLPAVQFAVWTRNHRCFRAGLLPEHHPRGITGF